MRIEVRTDEGKVVVGACDDECGLVATGRGEKLDDAVRDLVSKFAKYQKDTIEALNASGIIRYVAPETMS